MNSIISHIRRKYDSQEQNFSFTSVQNGEIGILLRSYDDLFSDFDPRSYSHRAFLGRFFIRTSKSSFR